MKQRPHISFICFSKLLLVVGWVCWLPMALQSQDTTDLSWVNRISLEKAVFQLESTFDCHFLYEPAVLRGHGLDQDWLNGQNKLATIISRLAELTKLEFVEIEPSYWVIKPVFSYGRLSGYIRNKEGEVLVGASVYHPQSQRGTATNLMGYFELWLPAGDITIDISYVGYQTLALNTWIPYGGSAVGNYELSSSLDLGEILVLSASTNSLTFLSPSAPTEVVAEQALKGIPASELNQLLQFAAPSFHATYQTNSDGTDHVVPAALRGLGPDQLLVLINGKRRHSSAMVNVNSTVGRGSVATDLNAIPISAIDHVEILPDGATAQYGADAIAGVINIVLKDTVGTNHLQLFSGLTSQGDGLRYGLAGHQQLWQTKAGFGNLSWRLDYRAALNRSGNYSGPIFGDDRDSDPLQRQAFFDDNPYHDQQVMLVGSAEARNTGMHWNMKGQLSAQQEWYAFGGFNFRQGRASGFYRFPYQQQKQSGLYPYGFSPLIKPQIHDLSQVIGLRQQLSNWHFDLSANWGGNAVTFFIDNSNNASMGLDSPVSARAGQLRYGQYQLQLDAVHQLVANKAYTLRAGTSWRNEQFRQLAGDEWSWQNYGDTTAAGLAREAGIQVFPGYRPSSTIRMNRSSLAAYAGIERCWKAKWFPTAAVRWEYWPTNGHYVLGKLALNYRLSKRFQLRAALNTGLRPPSLPQLYFSSQTLQFVPEGEKLVSREIAQLNSDHPFSRQVLNQPIKAERSYNKSLGVDWQIRPNVALQINAYQVDIKNRIILSSRLRMGENTLLDELLLQHNLAAVQLFMNALQTQTRGLDLSLQQSWSWHNYRFHLRLASSFNSTSVKNIKLVENLQNLENQIFNREEQARLESAQPSSKIITHLSVSRLNWRLGWQATRFGAVQYLHPDDAQTADWVWNEYTQDYASRDQKFRSKILQDVSLHWQANHHWTVGLHSRNIFNVYPDEHIHSANTNNGVFRYSRYVQQFGVWGTQFMLDVQLDF